MNYQLLSFASVLLAATSPATGDTRNAKTPIIIAVIAVVLIILCLVLGSKKGNGDGPKDK